MHKASDIQAARNRDIRANADRPEEDDLENALDMGAGQVSTPYQNEVQADAIAKQTKLRNDPND